MLFSKRFSYRAKFIIKKKISYFKYKINRAKEKKQRFNDGSPHFMAYQLRNETLSDYAKVAELFLYPHSKTSSKRTGVASRVLDHILKDAAERNIKVVFCEITNLDIKNFCQAKGFKGNYEPHCYVVI